MPYWAVGRSTARRRDREINITGETSGGGG
jgi:hypothetical protein